MSSQVVSVAAEPVTGQLGCLAAAGDLRVYLEDFDSGTPLPKQVQELVRGGRTLQQQPGQEASAPGNGN